MGWRGDRSKQDNYRQPDRYRSELEEAEEAVERLQKERDSARRRAQLITLAFGILIATVVFFAFGGRTTSKRAKIPKPPPQGNYSKLGVSAKPNSGRTVRLVDPPQTPPRPARRPVGGAAPNQPTVVVVPAP